MSLVENKSIRTDAGSFQSLDQIVQRQKLRVRDYLVRTDYPARDSITIEKIVLRLQIEALKLELSINRRQRTS